MLNTNFMATLLMIVFSIVLLFQNEIKESFTTHDPNVYGKYPHDGMIEKPLFGPPQGLGQQFKAVSTGPDYDKHGKPLRRIDRKLGFKLDERYNPRNSRENYVNDNFDVKMEAPRNMQPMTGGPPRFMTIEPKLNHYAPIDLKTHAVDTDHPIVNYGCNDVYSSSGQPQKVQAPMTKEDFNHNELPQDMMSLSGEPAQPIIVDRKMFSNIKSRYRRNQGDYIRGDLKPVPALYMSDGDGSAKEKAYNSWFQVAPNPSVDLISGYIDQHQQRGAEFLANAEASGLDPDLFETSTDNIDTANALIRHKNRDEYNRGSSVGFGSSNMETASKPIMVRYGTDIDVGSRGV